MPKSKPKIPNRLPRFPFFGAGDASYFEWFEMYVWFAAPIPKAKRAAIVKLAPKLCRMDAQWPADELLWPSTGDQWIQKHLTAEYGSKKAKALQAAHAKKLDDDSYDPWDDALIASASASTRFNADIEAWLIALDAIHPILFAARRQDWEAGGTRLSKWHQASVGRWAEIEPKIHAALAARKLKKDDGRAWAVRVAAAYIDENDQSAKTKAVAKRD